MNNQWSAKTYAIFRLMLGLYLAVHFLDLFPWGEELFSNKGILPKAELSPLSYLFPNILSVYDPPWFVFFLTLIGFTGSIAILVGIYDRGSAILVWYILACFFGRNPLIANPSLPVIGWMLIAHAFSPKLSSIFTPTNESLSWKMPREIFLAAWIVMSIGYTYSGVTKLVSPSWLDGSAIQYVLENPLARNNIVYHFIARLPEPCLQMMTWLTLALELLFAPLAIFKKCRPWLWLGMFIIHGSLLVLVNFADLTCGMLLWHAYTFDPGWTRKFSLTLAKAKKRMQIMQMTQ